ncbi:hypothetical protein [Galactobacillus timonensis]|uniref:hypothetical protein n=1 Tax=Galactobacillus timonensis TaxID=2041840 RepID=UPI000C845D01|nr:hypothetical protein [Galactobacillus timonensis]
MKRYSKAWWKNWWYYYKWYVIVATLVIGGIIRTLARKLSTPKPDIQIAYTGDFPLNEEEHAEIQNVLEAYDTDFNHDGKAIIQINQYLSGKYASAIEAPTYSYASYVTIMADMEDCQSYFFLMEDAGKVQADYQILAGMDGSIPSASDFRADDKVISWKALDPDCSIEHLAGLSIGHRYYESDKRCQYDEECEQLWNQLRKQSAS